MLNLSEYDSAHFDNRKPPDRLGLSQMSLVRSAFNNALKTNVVFGISKGFPATHTRIAACQPTSKATGCGQHCLHSIPAVLTQGCRL